MSILPDGSEKFIEYKKMVFDNSKAIGVVGWDGILPSDYLARKEMKEIEQIS